MSDSTFHILVVCTGNICRSPAAALLLASELADDARFETGSAGTRAMIGSAISAPMGELLRERGIRSTGFVARQATPALLAASDLILTATREQRTWVTTHEPRALRRAFTLAEFSEAAGSHPDPASLSATELVSWAAHHRPSALAASRGVTRHRYAEGDIPDPYRRGGAAYAASLARIEPLTAAISEVLLATG
jgi:protein-tyrosine phosphatase